MREELLHPATERLLRQVRVANALTRYARRWLGAQVTSGEKPSEHEKRCASAALWDLEKRPEGRGERLMSLRGCGRTTAEVVLGELDRAADQRRRVPAARPRLATWWEQYGVGQTVEAGHVR